MAVPFVLLGTVGVFAGFGFDAGVHAAPAAATVESIEPYEIPTDPWEEVPAGKTPNSALDEGGAAGESLDFEPLPHAKASFKDEAPASVATDKPTDPFDGVSLDRLFKKSKPVIQGKDSLRMALALAAVLALVLAFFKWVFPKLLPLLAREPNHPLPKASRPSRKAIPPSRLSTPSILAAGSQEPRPYEVLQSFPVHKHTRIELVSVWERYLLVGATREGSVSLGEVHPPDANDRQSQSWFEPTRTPQGEPISDVLQRHPAILQACLDCITERVFPPILTPAPPAVTMPPTVAEEPAAYRPIPAAEPSYSPYSSSRSVASEAAPSLDPELWSVLNKYLPNAVPPPALSPPTPLPYTPPRENFQPPPAPPSPVPVPVPVPIPPAPPVSLKPTTPQPLQPFVAPLVPTPKVTSPKELSPALPLPPPPLMPPAPPPEPEFITVLDDYDDIF
ncbi:MAG: hypothetical protein QE263_08910 [Vampirovibrionales bacterium]|nr:hypothetical protein [Vampirovibrionales bacterium]